MNNLKKTIVVAAIIILNNKVLIGRRNANQALGGYWEFPGGKLENNESLAQCLRREIREELGVNAIISDDIFAEYSYEYGGRKIQRVAMLANIYEELSASTAHDLLAWVNCDDLLTHKLVPSDISIAKKLINTKLTGRTD